jgi:hypothetical protein
VATIKSKVSLSSLGRNLYTIPEFCARNSISRQKYNRMREQGLGPRETRLGLNTIRVSADAERDWQQEAEKPRPDLEEQAAERAIKAGEAAAKSPKHVSKTRRKQKISSERRT